jgi:hypothetical protein
MLVAELALLVDARVPAASTAWLKAIRDPNVPMPDHDGLVWARVDGGALFARRA